MSDEGKRYRITDPLYETVDMQSVLSGFKFEDLEGNPCVGEFLYDNLLEPLLGTFELHRSKSVKQSIFLYNAYHGATHTRFAHNIGSWCVSCYALQDVTVRYRKDGKITTKKLGEWLLEKGLLSEFMASLLLHDIGHPPFSHALEGEGNIEPKLDHEKITYSLISAKPWRLDGDWCEKVNWYILLEYLLTSYYIEGNDFENASEYKRKWQEIKDSSETITVHEVLRNSVKGIKIEEPSVGSERRNPRSKRFDIFSLCSILYFEDFEKWGREWGDEYQRKFKKNKNVYSALHKIVESDLDLDRIDHFIRDSYYSGKKFADYRIRDHLQTLILVLDDEEKYEAIKKPCVSIKEEGMPHHLYLLYCRDMIINHLFQDERSQFSWAAFVMACKKMSEIDPVFREIVPFLTDNIVLQMFRENIFESERLDLYKRCAEKSNTKLKDYENFEYIVDGSVSKGAIEHLYDWLLRINKREEKIVALVYSNFQEPKDMSEKNDEAGREEKKVYLDRRLTNDRREGVGILDQATEQSLLDWIEKRENLREGNVILWTLEGVRSEVEDELEKVRGFIKEELGGEKKRKKRGLSEV